VVDGAVWEVTNQAIGDSDRAGENGFAVKFTGPASFDLPWVLRWAKVSSTGTTGNGYHYADCVECGNGAGDSPATTPVRVFFQSQGALPNATDVVAYVRDNSGLAYAVVGGDAGSIFGKLDSALLYSNSTGVTVSVYSDPDTDSGVDIANVTAPPWMTEGTLPTGTYVKLESWGGEWTIVGAWVWKEVIVDLQVASGKVQAKTCNILVFVSGDNSAWADSDGQSSVTAHNIVTDFQITSTKVQTKTRSIYVNPAAAESGWTDEDTITECP
jgi:hypothetical protein